MGGWLVGASVVAMAMPACEPRAPGWASWPDGGQAIGGIMSPFVSLVSVIAAYLAFRAQIKANDTQFSALQEQRLQIEAARHREEISAFETRFFQLVQMHRDNVDRMKLGDDLRGVEVFKHMVVEFGFLYLFLRRAMCYYSYDMNELNSSRDNFKPLTVEEYTRLVEGFFTNTITAYRFINFIIRPCLDHNQQTRNRLRPIWMLNG